MPTPAPGVHPPAVTGIAKIHLPANRKVAEVAAAGHAVLPAVAAGRTSTPDLNSFSAAYAT